MITRRRVLAVGGGAAIGAGMGLLGGPVRGFAKSATLPFANGERELVAYPGKRPLLRLNARPPQLETPFAVFNESLITPNDAFFVRYHHAGIPTSIDPDTYTVSVDGLVNTPLKLSLDDLKTGFDPVEITAVHQCSGNSRGFFNPRMPGGQVANGLMGCAVWKGAPLKAVLEKAGVKAGAVQVTFDGLDRPVMDKTPDFVKSLNIDHALEGEVMIAYQMNGEDIPWLNGYPVKLVVPGYFGTYWIKHLSNITVVDSIFEGFWMKPVYRIPDNACACVEPGTKPSSTVPINRFSIRSFITSVSDGAKVPAGPLKLRGIAFDGGWGITEIDTSTDGGMSWQAAKLGEDHGKYAFREWTTTVDLGSGEHVLMVRAVNRIGQTQPMTELWNPTGYMRNVVEAIHVTAA